MVNLFTRICPKIPFRGLPPSSPREHPSCLRIVKGNLVPSTRLYADKSEKPGGKKGDEIGIKMPGLVHPETLKEEGYFSLKAKKQMEELKRNLSKSSVSNPEKTK